jgi:hypothetical protein
MTHIQLDEISADELYALNREIDSFINTQDAAERAYCEGSSEYGELLETSLDKAQQNEAAHPGTSNLSGDSWRVLR